MRPVRDILCSPVGQRGFSLVELVMIMTIIAVTAAIAMPRYANALNRYGADVAARRVAADIALAQELARSSSSSRTITFDLAASRYTVSGMSSLSNQAAPYTIDLTAQPYQARMVSLNLASDALAISFNGYGAPDRGGSLQVARGGITRTITVDGSTGAVAIQ